MQCSWPTYKVVVCGPYNVGKTSLLCAIKQGRACTTQQASTIGADIDQHVVELPDGRTAQLQLWDTAGQERFRSLAPTVYRGARAVVAVYDVTDAQSYRVMLAMLDEALRSVGGKPDPHVMVLGNKSDLPAHWRQVSQQDAAQFCAERNYSFGETSATEYHNVREMMLQLTSELLGPKPIVFTNNAATASTRELRATPLSLHASTGDDRPASCGC